MTLYKWFINLLKIKKKKRNPTSTLHLLGQVQVGYYAALLKYLAPWLEDKWQGALLNIHFGLRTSGKRVILIFLELTIILKVAIFLDPTILHVTILQSSWLLLFMHLDSSRLSACSLAIFSVLTLRVFRLMCTLGSICIVPSTFAISPHG